MLVDAYHLNTLISSLRSPKLAALAYFHRGTQIDLAALALARFARLITARPPDGARYARLISLPKPTYD